MARDTCALIETQAGTTEQESETVQYANTFIISEEKWRPWNRKKGVKIMSKKEVDEKVLSASDIETLTFIWSVCKADLRDLWKKTHLYPEGKKAEGGRAWAEIKEEELFSTIENDPLGEQTVAEIKNAEELYRERKEAKMAFGVTT